MKPHPRLIKLVKGIRHMLIAQFLLGVGLATYAAANPDADMKHQPVANMIFLGLHALLALSMLVAAIRAFLIARKDGEIALRQNAGRGLLAIVLALVGGVLTQMPDTENLGICVMSVGFIAAFIIYGKWAVLSSKS